MIPNDLNYDFLSHRDSLNYILVDLIFLIVAALFIFNAQFSGCDIKGRCLSRVPCFGAKHLPLTDEPHSFSFVKLHACTEVLAVARYKNSFNLNYLHTEN